MIYSVGIDTQEIELGRGSYLGGSTVIRVGSSWFSKDDPLNNRREEIELIQSEIARQKKRKSGKDEIRRIKKNKNRPSILEKRLNHLKKLELNKEDPLFLEKFQEKEQKVQDNLRKRTKKVDFQIRKVKKYSPK